MKKSNRSTEMNTIIFLIILSTGTTTTVIKEMPSLVQCKVIMNSVYKQQKEKQKETSKTDYYCLNSTTNTEYYPDE